MGGVYAPQSSNTLKNTFSFLFGAVRGDLRSSMLSPVKHGCDVAALASVRHAGVQKFISVQFWNKAAVLTSLCSAPKKPLKSHPLATPVVSNLHRGIDLKLEHVDPIQFPFG